MKKLFYLLLCLPLAFAACQPEEPGIENKVYNLSVTSESVLNFEAEGGQGVITYNLAEVTRTKPVPEPQVEATCAAAWVTELTVAENITFNVAANEGDARETKVVITYGEQKFEVAVKQAAKPQDGVVFEAKVLTGEYYGEYYTQNAGNYYIFFSDNGFDENGYLRPNSTYYQLDLYGPLFEGEAENGYVTLPAGTYYLDPNDTMACNTIGYSYSEYMVTDDEYVDEYYFDDAELVVNEDGSCVLTAMVGGVKHRVTFSGESTISDKREVNQGGENVEMGANFAYAYYYGDQYNPGISDNFYLFLSDVGVDADGWELPNGTYYRFDLYSELVNKEEGLAIPYGTYTLDSGTMIPYTISMGYSAYYVMDDAAWDYAVSGAPIAGTVVIDETGVTAHVMVNGGWHTVTYEGGITIVDASSGGEGGGEGEGPYSTLWEDYRCNFDGHTLYYAYYSDYYEVGYMNWTFAVMPNDGEGDFVQFDVLAGANSTTDFFGEYEINDTYGAYTSYPGYIDWDGYMVGAWYYTDDGYTMAPFVDGTMSVVDNGDGTVSVEFDVYDDCDNNITGSWTGKMLSADELSTRSSSFNKGEIKQVNAPVKSAIKVQKRDIAKF